MRRRDFIVGLGFSAACPFLAYAQQKPMPLIGYAALSTAKLAESLFARLSKGLAEHGYVEGQNFRFEVREANFDNNLVPNLFRELVDQKVSVIITVTSLQLNAARAATQSIPIVFDLGIDPVKNGFVASLNRPGGNITGVFTLNVMLADKWIQMFHELIPSAKKFAYLTDPGNEFLTGLQLPQVQATADSLGLSLLNVYAHTQDELEGAFETAARGGAGGMVIGTDAIFYAFATQLVALADRYRLPTMYMEVGAPIVGGLISYSTDAQDADRLVGNYVGRILKGEKPADLPVQQSTRTKLIVNLRTAKAQGITVPTSLLVRADEVIE